MKGRVQRETRLVRWQIPASAGSECGQECGEAVTLVVQVRYTWSLSPATSREGAISKT